MAFRVEPTFQAQQELEGILDWLLEQGAGETGLRWFFKLEDAIASLSGLPHRCPLAPESKEFPYEVRQLVYGRKPHQYRVLYTIDGETVVVLHIRHGRREHLPRTQDSGSQKRQRNSAVCQCNRPRIANLSHGSRRAAPPRFGGRD